MGWDPNLVGKRQINSGETTSDLPTSPITSTAVAGNKVGLDVALVSGSVSVTGPLAVTQSGTWNINNISGSISLPTGAATETTLSTASTTLTTISNIDFATETTLSSINSTLTTISNIDFATQTTLAAVSAQLDGIFNLDFATETTLDSLNNKIPSGLTVTATRLLVDGSGVTQPISGTVSASQSGTWNINNISGTISLPTGAATETTLSAVNAKFNSLGQKTSANSAPVVLSSDQSAIPVTDNSGSLTVDGTVSANQSGTWNINNISGTISLPTGAATVSNQSNIITLLQQVESKTTAMTAFTSTYSVTAGGIDTAGNNSYLHFSTAGNLLVRHTDGTNFTPIMDAVGRAGFQKITDGTNTMPTMDVGSRSGFVKLYDGSTFYNVPMTIVAVSGFGIAPVLPTDAFFNFQRFLSDGSVGSRSVSTDGTLNNSKYALCDSSNRTVVTKADGYKSTYSMTATALAPAATATDIFTLTGSATKTIRILKIEITATQTTAGVQEVIILKRSTANSGGTSTTLTLVPYDSSSSAATAVGRSYTANPTTGTLVGNINSRKIQVSTNLLEPTFAQFKFGEESGQAIVLRGTSQVCAVNLNGVTWSGGSIDLFMEWTEE